MNLLRLLITIGIISILFSCKEPPPRPVIRIIPLPAEVTDQEGLFALAPSTRIGISTDNEQMRQIALFLTSHTEKYYGIVNRVVFSDTGDNGSVFLKLDENLKLGKEDYHLSVTQKGVVIEAAAPNGLFYGIQTLIQLMPPTPKQVKEIILPGVEIKDSPRFAWRGLHLDVSRHFMPKEFIMKYLDYMAMHKFNTFQWHLADDQGWRIEIKKYPRLTEIGSVRKKTMIGHINNPLGTDTIPYGGFYSQNDVREIVAYASERYITIVPGVEMPGHALAALASYPELGCTGLPYEVASKWGVFSDVYCPGKEGTFTFMKDVITEMTALFPGRYFHIGGAECSEIRWEQCPSCQLKMKTDSLNSTHDLYNYFVRRIGRTLDSLGKDMVGWDEIVKDTLLTKKIVMSWRGEAVGISATQRKLQTVMSPAKFCNFDQYQADPKGEPLAVGGLLTLEQVYNFEPVPKDLSRQEAKYIIGAQANVWTQYMKTPEYVEYMIFPRAAALSEVLWSPKGNRNYKWFRKRLLEQIKRYDAEGIRYCKTEFKALND
ncbi:MAG: beta-N-acetylhexosaminidase [Bacteroidia bacterium]|nr:beta-N-acetylhexosaminidase [Bacteroidia bacterium]